MNIERILRRDEVEKRCGIARSTIYYWIQQGEFPQSIKIGTRAVGWLESDITDWVSNRQRVGATK